MFFTTNFKWKDLSYNINSIVPTSSKYSPATDTPPNVRKANPLRQYRKQLNPTNNGSHRGASVSQIERPGGSVSLNNSSTYSDNKCCDVNNTYFTTYILDLNQTVSKDGSGDDCCNPETLLIKSGLTDKKLLSKANPTTLAKPYYYNRSSYLQSRGLTFNQKSTYSKREGITYIDANNVALYPNNTDTGPQIFNTNYCVSGNCQSTATPPKNLTTIYKPNNRDFAQQGAVSGSTRLAKLKYDTITRNGNSFRSAFGAQGANAGKYHGTSTSPYFVKSKNYVCNPTLFHVRGNRTSCS